MSIIWKPPLLPFLLLFPPPRPLPLFSNDLLILFLLLLLQKLSRKSEKEKENGNGNGNDKIFDYKAALDVEIHVIKSVIILPHIHKPISKDGFEIGRHSLYGNDVSAICVYGNFNYNLSLRGFLLGLYFQN